jgi:hypothetical protein
VVLLIEERNEAWGFYKVEIGLNTQVLQLKTELVDILAREEGCTRQIEEESLFITTGFI